jgi:hypothetical protein
MKEIIFPCSVGILSAFFCQKYFDTYQKEHYKNYIFAIALMFFMQFMIWIASCFSATDTCQWCYYLDDRPNLRQTYFDQYNFHEDRAQEYYNTIELIKNNHKYGAEDMFVSGACGAVVSIPIRNARAKAIAIALTVVADFFKEKYFCHRSTKRLVEAYRYEIFQMERYMYQLENNISLCSACLCKFDSEHYWGEPYVKYLEFWKTWWEDIDAKANYKPGCLHTQ